MKDKLNIHDYIIINNRIFKLSENRFIERSEVEYYQFFVDSAIYAYQLNDSRNDEDMIFDIIDFAEKEIEMLKNKQSKKPKNKQVNHWLTFSIIVLIIIIILL